MNHENEVKDNGHMTDSHRLDKKKGNFQLVANLLIIHDNVNTKSQFFLTML